MANRNRSNSNGDRSEPMNVGPEQAPALAAAYRGVYHWFNGRVQNWQVTDDGLVAEGFTVDSQYDPDTILTYITRSVRRAPLMPTILWINGKVPSDFEDPSDVTTHLTQFYKEEGSTRTAEFARTAAAAYKDRLGTFPKRGRPKAGIINALKSLAEANEEAFANAGLSKAEIDNLMSIIHSATNKSDESSEPVEANA